MADAELTPAMQRAGEVVKRVAELKTPGVAEIGVFKGDMSLQLLKMHPGLRLFMVDSWSAEGHSDDYRATQDFLATLPQSKHDLALEVAILRTEFAAERTTIFKGKSVEVAEEIEDHTLDLVFIDGDHSYTGSKADIQAWESKVKPGGWLGGHDYRTDLPFGVKDAVDEYISDNNLTLELGENHTWFIHRR
jgi:hypothetical protein